MPVEYRDDAGTIPGDAGNAAIDPATVDAAAPAEPGTGKRKRGRPAGSGGKSAAGTGTQKGKVALDLSSITGLFVGAHVLLAERANIPELALSMDEGQTFMKAAQNVMRHYSVQTTQKTMDWISFAGVTCMIYVPRVVAITNRSRQKPVDNVVRFTPTGQPPVGTAVPGPGYDAPPGSPLEGAFAMSAVQPDHS